MRILACFRLPARGFFLAVLFGGLLVACGQARTPEIDFDGTVGYPNGAQLQHHFRLVTEAGDKGNVVACEIDTKDAGAMQSPLTHLTCAGTQVECKDGRVTRFQLNLNGWLAGTFVGADAAHPLTVHYTANESSGRFDLAQGDPASLPANLTPVPVSGSGKAIAECGQDGSLWETVIGAS